MTDALATATAASAHDFAETWLPVFTRAGGPSETELSAFDEACYSGGMIVVFDWIEWRDQGHVLLETSGAMQRASLEELRQLLTMILRQERFAEGSLAHAVSQGWIHAILGRMLSLTA